MIPGYWNGGDSAYESRDGIVTPSSKSQFQCPVDGTSRDAFNFYQSSSRVHVEQAFGMLVARFGILWCPLKFDLRREPLIISTCVRLHNYCIAEGVPSVRSSLDHCERLNVGETFRTWWKTAQPISRSDGEFQGRRRDQDSSFIREELKVRTREGSNETRILARLCYSLINYSFIDSV